jgi:group I intron endonuclease
MKAAGVYAILNTVNGKRYVGSSLNLRKRKLQHFRDLDRGTGHHQKLQRAYSKYGSQAFKFEVLLLCDAADLLFFEERAIAVFRSATDGYNTRAIPGSNLGLKMPQSVETRRKISIANQRAHAGRPGPWAKGRPKPTEINAKQSRTRRTLFAKYEFGGHRMCLSDWADKIGISLTGLQNRIARGWPLERALSEKSRGY